ncbi:MAG: hypothetical protein WC054_14005 [Candidatus Nanopelagicales bacterium]
MATHGDLITAHRTFYLRAQMVRKGRKVVVFTAAGCVGAVSSALLVGGVTTGAVALGSAASGLLARGDAPLTVQSRVDAKRETVAAVLTDASFVCGMIANCDKATKSGSTISARLDLPIGSQPIRIKLGNQIPGKAIPFSYSTKSSLGSASADAVITLHSSRGGTLVRYTTISSQSSGALGRAMTYHANIAIKNAMSQAGASFTRFTEAQYPMGISLAKTSKKLSKGKRAKVKARAWIRTPVTIKPLASGTGTVIVNGKKVCTVNLKNSAGSCTFKPKRSGRTTIAISFSGSFSDGAQMFSSARIARKVR